MQALWLAAQSGHLRTVKTLLSLGASPLKKSTEGVSPFFVGEPKHIRSSKRIHSTGSPAHAPRASLVVVLCVCVCVMTAVNAFRGFLILFPFLSFVHQRARKGTPISYVKNVYVRSIGRSNKNLK